MESLIDIKIRSRRALHDRLKRTAYLYRLGSGMKVIGVRTNTEPTGMGDVKGTSFVYAERRDVEPTLIFLAEQHQPLNGDIVMLSPTEGYRVEAPDPPYNITISAMAARLGPKDLALYKAPPDAVVYSASRGLLPTSSVSVV